ncbi:phage replisome organizer N-terminal domain-containing protein [Streptococcus oralis]|uniref:phage replisome organizer N-terminal domain-containing protein n=1 Tax=Streptococcus oralis TaxID=1303 RepID=UPI003EE298EC
MSEIKWIKITTDVFDDEKICLIDALPDHDAILVIWFKILVLAGKLNKNGVLAISPNLVYTDEMLANRFQRPLNTVRMALGIFERFGMIEVIEGVITLPNWEKHQNIDGMEKVKEQTRKRVARHREKQKELAIGNVTCNVTVTESNGTEEERDEDKELDKDENITINSNSENILELFQSEFRRLLSGFEIEEINHLLNENDSGLVKEALRTAVTSGKPNVSYIGGILRNWRQKQVTTVEQVRQSEKQRKEKKDEQEAKDEWGF